MSRFQQALVVGSGTMGSGIAQAFAGAGLKVSLFDANPEAPARALLGIEKSVNKLASKGKISEQDAAAIVGRITPVQELSAGAEADVVIEAIFENLQVKKELFAQLDGICPPSTVLLTNTSSLSVTEMANATSAERKANFLGMHFFNPVPLMKLVEVVRTPFTSEEAFQEVWDLGKACGKSPVECKDTPGFLFNRLILPYLNEAAWAVYEGVGRIEDLDQAMVLGGNMPIGPLALCDLIGNDVLLHAVSAMAEETGEPKYRPCPLLRQMVRAGYLGRKTKLGFYDYRGEASVPTDLSVFRFK